MSKPAWVGAIVALSAVVAAAIVAVTLLHGNSRRVTAVADQFPVPASWSLQAQTVTGDQVICLGDNPCPSVFRTYRLPAALTPGQLRAMLRQAGWDFAVTGDCRPLPRRIGLFTTCSAEGDVHGYHVYVKHDSSDDPAQGALVHLAVTG